jgi:hypothetical protein
MPRRWKTGPIKNTLYSKVWRISLGPQDRDLLPFFERLAGLPAGQRNAALLAAIRGGASAGLAALECSTESRKISATIDTLLDEL